MQAEPAVAKTIDNKYAVINFDHSIKEAYMDLRLSIFDSLGNLLKSEIIKYDAAVSEDVTRVYSMEFAKIDSFNNLMAFYNYADSWCQPCGDHYLYKSITFNLDFLQQVNGIITDSLLPLSNIPVELILNGHSYFTTTDDSGRYNFAPFDTGHGLIILHLDSNPQFANSGNDTIPVVLSDTIANPIVNYLLRTVLTSAKNNFSKIKTVVYPNPFHDFTTISFNYNKPTKLLIYSVDGKLIHEYSGTEYNYMIRKNSLANGLYFFELRDKETNELLSKGKIITE